MFDRDALIKELDDKYRGLKSRDAITDVLMYGNKIPAGHVYLYLYYRGYIDTWHEEGDLAITYRICDYLSLQGDYRGLVALIDLPTGELDWLHLDTVLFLSDLYSDSQLYKLAYDVKEAIKQSSQSL